MNTASAWATASARSRVNCNRPAAVFLASMTSSPGSKIGTSPAFSRAIFSESLSTQTTSWPKSEKQTPETSPT